MWATEVDVPAVRSFLEAHVTGSMFPLVNLRDNGLDGDHPRSVNFWVLRDVDFHIEPGTFEEVLQGAGVAGLLPRSRGAIVHAGIADHRLQELKSVCGQ